MRSKSYSTLGLLIIFLSGCSIFKNSADTIPKPEMVAVPGGTFMMGDIYGDDNPDAKPVHKVSLPDFRIGKYEVTYEEYDAFARRTDRPLPLADSLERGQRAVVYVNWEQAKSFCEYHGWRLPTEQEWEYAARSGGRKMRFSGTNKSDSLTAYARTEENSSPFSFEVGTKKPNDAGLYDMSGNVFEWIGGYYQFYPKNGQKPKWDDMEERTLRIIRGGSFRESKEIATTYWRVGVLEEASEYDIGFRCVDPLQQ